MLFRNLCCAAVVFVASAISVGAQPLGTDFFIMRQSSSFADIIRMTPGGAVTTVAKLPAAKSLSAFTLDVDNRTLICPAYGGELHRLDSVTGTWLSTIKYGPYPLASLIDVDQDGEYVLSHANGDLLRVSRDGSASSTLFSIGFMVSFAEDKGTGDWIVRGGIQTQRGLWHLDRDTLSVTTFVSVSTQGSIRQGQVQDPHRRMMYLSQSNSSGLRYDPVNHTTLPFPSLGIHAIAVDRAPRGDGGLLYVDYFGSLAIFDRTGTQVGSVGTLVPFAGSALTFDQSRNLAPVLQAPPNKRSIRVSFPSDANKPYVLALGVSGYTPGLRLPGGRVVPLNVDNLTIATVQGPIPPLLTNNIGVLDASGEAVVTFDVNPLGRGVKRVRVWAVALTLDPRAPLGISQISAPLLFVL